jgi:hypothetical protein
MINVNIQSFFSDEQEEARSSCEQRILRGPGTAFQKFKSTDFFHI